MMPASNHERYFQTPPLWWYIFALGGISTLGLLAFTTLLPVVLPYQPLLQNLFLLVIVIHVLEAMYAYWLASSYPLKIKRWQWTWQTLFLGVYSLILLKQITKRL